MYPKINGIIITISFSVLLSACGGGGGGNSPANPQGSGGETPSNAPEPIAPNLQYSYSNKNLSLDREKGQLLGQMILTDLLQADEFMWDAQAFHNFENETGMPDFKNYGDASVTEACPEGGTLTTTSKSAETKFTALYSNCVDDGITSNGVITLQFHNINYESNSYNAIYQFDKYTETSESEVVGYLDGYLLYSQAISDLNISVFESHLETIQPLTKEPYVSKLKFSAASGSNDEAQFYNLSGTIQTSEGVAILSLKDHKMLNSHYDEEDIGIHPEPTTSTYKDPEGNEFTLSAEFQRILSSVYIKDSASYFSRYTQSVEKNNNLLRGIATDDVINYSPYFAYTSPIDEPAYIHPGYFVDTNAFTFIELDVVQSFPINNRASINIDSLLQVSGAPDLYKFKITSSDENTFGSDGQQQVYLSTRKDFDSDGIADHEDEDDDGDGYYDDQDEFPLDFEEWEDTDLDGVGNNSDPDIDGDGYFNEDDLFPEEVMCANEYETVNGGCVFYSYGPNDVMASDRNGILYIMDDDLYMIQRWNSITGRLIIPVELDRGTTFDKMVYSESEDRLYMKYNTDISYIDNPSSSDKVEKFIDEGLQGSVDIQAMDDALFVTYGSRNSSSNWSVEIYDSNASIIESYSVSSNNAPINPLWNQTRFSMISGYNRTGASERFSRTDFSDNFSEHETLHIDVDQEEWDLEPYHISDTEIFTKNGRKISLQTMTETDPVSVPYSSVLFANSDYLVVEEAKYDGDYAVLYNHSNEKLAELKCDVDSIYKAIVTGDNVVIIHRPTNHTLRLTVMPL
ncbi:MAG: hypothetical protein CMI00_09450 [Oceanospirillaceae bacterium]|nr:hypothetical protein [Oceanospirillaceae bacterium]|tara:strand:+ start:161 stop:2554 length:2394 start_codon:yes stop_codon:yes gene_type:complete